MRNRPAIARGVNLRDLDDLGCDRFVDEPLPDGEHSIEHRLSIEQNDDGVVPENEINGDDSTLTTLLNERDEIFPTHREVRDPNDDLKFPDPKDMIARILDSSDR